MVSLNKIKQKSASMRTKENKIKISPADPNSSSFFKGNAPNIADLREKLKQEEPVQAYHVRSVLMNSTVGRLLSTGLHLDYKFNLHAAESLADHDYCKKTFHANVLNIDPQKRKYK